jgi:glutamate/tyrosine decarboxylase-like PLP-dependent enzyme
LGQTARLTPLPDDAAAASLDPADWAVFRAQAHAALDRAIGRLEHAGDGPVWRPTPDEVRHRFEARLPRRGRGLDAALADLEADIAPYVVGNTHPRFFGWAHGAGTPIGLVAEMIAAGLNANCGGRDHVGPIVEQQVTRWAAEAFGFPHDSSGIFVTGTSQANFLGLLVARDALLGHRVRGRGLKGGARQLTAYCSTEAHACVSQAMELAGAGSDFLRCIETDAEGRIRVELVAAAIAADREAGLAPFLIVGTAGSVNFGAFDDLAALADLAAAERLWLHVDGAFGAMTRLAPSLVPLTRGLERAHSVAFDFHKWAHAPYDAGFLLVRDRAAHKGTFAVAAAYLSRTHGGLSAGEDWPCDYGPDLSRGFRALKVWLQFQALGASAIGAAIEANCAAARRLAGLIENSNCFELAAPVPLNIVCFRIKGDKGGAASLELALQLQEQGLAAPSTTRIGGWPVVRTAIFNHRTSFADIDAYFADARRLARRLLPK